MPESIFAPVEWVRTSPTCTELRLKATGYCLMQVKGECERAEAERLMQVRDGRIELAWKQQKDYLWHLFAIPHGDFIAQCNEWKGRWSCMIQTAAYYDKDDPIGHVNVGKNGKLDELLDWIRSVLTGQVALEFCSTIKQVGKATELTLFGDVN